MKTPQKIALYPLLAVSLALLISGCQPKQPIPGVIQGASMAPNWLGEHQWLTCRDCQFPIRFQLDPSDVATNKLVCPNCGYRENLVSDSSARPAQQVLIHAGQPISRWDVVASKLPDSQLMGIKRAVGLPGERLEIKGGDVHVNGRIIIKPWELQKEMRIPVYDSTFEPRLEKAHERWVPMDSLGLWRRHTDVSDGAEEADQTFWEFTVVEGNESKPPMSPLEFSWLSYQHWRCCAHAGSRYDRFPLEDIDSFNPSLKRPALNSMVDFCFEIALNLSADAVFGWKFQRGDDNYECRLDADKKRLSISKASRQPSNKKQADSKSTISITLPEGLINFDESNMIEVSTFDNQLIILVNEHSLVDQPLFEYPGEPAPDFIQLGASRGKVTLISFKLWRDIFYLPLSDGLVTLLEPDSYFLLGDNVPVSVDSRHWKPTGISRKNILGIVKSATN